jgi:hypothetical protein
MSALFKVKKIFLSASERNRFATANLDYQKGILDSLENSKLLLIIPPTISLSCALRFMASAYEILPRMYQHKRNNSSFMAFTSLSKLST